MSNSQQFVKNTNVPAPESELWSIADGWKISNSTGIPYTKLDNVYATPNDHELVDALKSQLSGNVKESIDFIGHYLVAAYSKDGTALLYAYGKHQKDEAEKKASYNNGVVPTGNSTGGGNNNNNQTTKTTFSTATRPTNTSTQSTISVSASPQNPKPTFTKQTTEVPFDVRPITWNDIEAIEQALSEGLYILPVKYVGVENWGFIGEESGQRTFWYGKLKTVEIE